MSKFYVVATPIGNLGDLTYRAVEILQKVDTVLAEDTRVSKKLLEKYQIETPLLSYRDQNHKRITPVILQKLNEGESIALVSDAGTPLISDPGFKLVSELIKNQVEVISIPGPSAVISALSISGLPTDRFAFIGFLPKSKKRREDLLRESMEIEQTVVIYESPYRVLKLLELVGEIDPDRSVVIANDLTKMYETCWRGKASTMKDLLPKEGSLKGEFVVMIGKKDFSVVD